MNLIRRTAATGAAAVLALALFAGCGSSEPDSGGPSTPATTQSQPSGTPTLSTRDRAIAEATEAVRRYEQMWGDILHDKTPDLNDMNLVATGEQLDSALVNLQRLSAVSQVLDPGKIVVVTSRPLAVDLVGRKQTVTVLACVDKTSREGVDDKGRPWTGAREEMQYTLLKTTYLPEPGWAVSKILPPPGSDGPRRC